MSKQCHKCQVEKDILDFYKYSTGQSKSICKQCCSLYKQLKLWSCPICELTIRRRCKNRHENYSQAHVKCLMMGEPYYMILQPQNCRSLSEL